MFFKRWFSQIEDAFFEDEDNDIDDETIIINCEYVIHSCNDIMKLIDYAVKCHNSNGNKIWQSEATCVDKMAQDCMVKMEDLLSLKQNALQKYRETKRKMKLDEKNKRNNAKPLSQLTDCGEFNNIFKT